MASKPQKARLIAVRLTVEDQRALKSILDRRVAFNTTGAIRYAIHQTAAGLEEKAA